MKYRVFRTLPLFVVLSAVAFAQDLASFEKRITVKKLNNGLTVVICERPEAPVFAFFTHVDAGSVQDPLGETGMAHMFEHMAFKGTDKIGTTDYAAEKVALQKVEQAYAAYLAERDKRVDRDDQKLKEWEKAWQAAIAEAQRYVKPNEFPQILESNGAEGLNAFTNEDETAYHYSLPETAPAHGQQSDWTAAGAVCDRSISGSSIPPTDNRLDVRLEFVFGNRRAEIL